MNLKKCANARCPFFFLHMVCRREGGVFMFGCNPYGGGYGPSVCGGGYGYGRERRRYNYGGSTFVLIVVLFILLIIVGSSFV